MEAEPFCATLLAEGAGTTPDIILERGDPSEARLNGSSFAPDDGVRAVRSTTLVACSVSDRAVRQRLPRVLSSLCDTVPSLQMDAAPSTSAGGAVSQSGPAGKGRNRGNVRGYNVWTRTEEDALFDAVRVRKRRSVLSPFRRSELGCPSAWRRD